MASSFRAMRSTPRLRIVKRRRGEDGAEEEQVLVTNELGAAGGACGPYPSPGDVVGVIAANDDPSCTLLQETARQGTESDG